MPDADYAVLRSTQELETLVAEWTELWQRDPEATPFQRPEWLLPWWRHFGSRDLRAATIRHGGLLVGFVPFYIYQQPTDGQRQLLLLGAGTTDYLNGVFAPECDVAEIRKALDLICAEGAWDVMYATQLPAGAKLASVLCERAKRAGSRFEGESCWRMAAGAMTELPQKIRRNAMYYRNRALRLGSLELTCANSLNWEDAFATLQRLHSARWQARGESGVLAEAQVLAWHREALPLLERSGCLRLCSLRLDGQILGVLYSLIDLPSRTCRTQYFYLTGYAEEHAALRPGTLLLAFAIEAGAREGVQTIDMLRGEEAYKQIWHLERVATCGFAIRPDETFEQDACSARPPA